MEEVLKDSNGKPLEPGFYFDREDLEIEYFVGMHFKSESFTDSYSVGDQLHHRPIDYIRKNWVRINPQAFLESQKEESNWLERKLFQLEKQTQKSQPSPSQPKCTEGEKKIHLNSLLNSGGLPPGR